jgi:hypothetical protein
VMTGQVIVDRSHRTYRHIMATATSSTGSDRQANDCDHLAATKDLPLQNASFRG